MRACWNISKVTGSCIRRLKLSESFERKLRARKIVTVTVTSSGRANVKESTGMALEESLKRMLLTSSLLELSRVFMASRLSLTSARSVESMAMSIEAVT